MIDRGEFERYLCNNYGCRMVMQRDVTLCREVGGQTYYATFGNHTRDKVYPGEARRLLQKLGFAAGSAEYIQICQDKELL